MKKESNEISLFTYALQQEIFCFQNPFNEILHAKTRKIPLFVMENDEERKLKGIPELCPKIGCVKNHDCKKCIYHKDYFLLIRTCISRDKENSLWDDIIIVGPFEDGNDYEYLGVVIAGKKKNEETAYYTNIVSLCNDRSKPAGTTIKYLDPEAEYDNYALTMIIEALRIIA